MIKTVFVKQFKRTKHRSGQSQKQTGGKRVLFVFFFTKHSPDEYVPIVMPTLALTHFLLGEAVRAEGLDFLSFPYVPVSLGLYLLLEFSGSPESNR